MNRITPVALALALALVVSVGGCYHAVIETDLEPSNRTIEQPFASSWVYGLVPPKLVKTAEECPDGVAMVVTEISFVNGLVGVLTLGIYTPMHITVTCAAGGTASAESAQVEIGADATQQEKREAMTEAARLSKESGSAVYVVMVE